MTELVGETVTVQRRTKTGENAHGQAIYEWADEEVEDVLVAPGPRADVAESGRPDGVTVAWSLYWPKTYTASLRGARVLLQHDDKPCLIVGDPRPYPDAPTPTRWNRPSEASRVDG